MSTKTRKNQHLMASHRILQYTLITLRFILVAFPASGAAIPSHSNSINVSIFFVDEATTFEVTAEKGVLW